MVALVRRGVRASDRLPSGRSGSRKSDAYIVGMPITTAPALTHLSDLDLVATVTRLVAREHDATADLIAALAEFDARRLYLGDGCASLFTYCIERLHLSESAAYHRITAARVARRFPLILDRLRAGALTLTAVGLLAPHLTDANHREVLDAARHQGKRAIEELVARLHARPDIVASVRKLPAPRVSAADRTALAEHPAALPNVSARAGAGRVASPSQLAAADADVPTASTLPSLRRPAVVRALAPARYQVQVTVSAETHAKLRRAQDLLRHVIPNGDPAAVLDRALTVLLDQLERSKCAATSAPRPASPAQRRQPRRAPSPDARPANAPQSSLEQARVPERVNTSRSSVDHLQLPDRVPGREPHRCSRTIPADIRRSVWARDGGQCTYVGASGRCTERGFLEFHHRVPFAAGGEATVENVALLCRAHNAHEAGRDFPLAIEAVAPSETIGGLSRRDRSTSSGAS